MKKILCVVLTLLVVFSCGANTARAEDLESELDDIFEEFVSDVDDFSDQELVALREQLCSRFETLGTLQGRSALLEEFNRYMFRLPEGQR